MALRLPPPLVAEENVQLTRNDDEECVCDMGPRIGELSF